MAVNTSSYAHPDFREYLGLYKAWLIENGITHRRADTMQKKARSFLVRQSPQEDPSFAKFMSLPGNDLAEAVRAFWVAENDRRVLPLNREEKKAVQAAASRFGDTTAMRLRNSAIIALLLNPMPRSVRPSSLRWLTFNDCYRDDEEAIKTTEGRTPSKFEKFRKFSEWPEIERGPDYKITAIMLDSRTGKQLIPLDINSSEHFSRYVMHPDGWEHIKSYWGEYIFVPIGVGKSLAGQSINPISRQIIWTLVKNVGEAAGIKGKLYPDILKLTPVWDDTK